MLAFPRPFFRSLWPGDEVARHQKPASGYDASWLLSWITYRDHLPGSQYHCLPLRKPEFDPVRHLSTPLPVRKLRNLVYERL